MEEPCIHSLPCIYLLFDGDHMLVRARETACMLRCSFLTRLCAEFPFLAK